MAYPAYDTYNPQFGYPLSHTLSHAAPVYGVHPNEIGYDPTHAGTAYTDVSTSS